jgi:LDH2 family malate/lactate/ureidoglycolate dehydrogenase
MVIVFSGPVVGDFCMKLAIEKAKNVGIGIVTAKRSNHYGIAGHYAVEALKHNFIVKAYSQKFLS